MVAGSAAGFMQAFIASPMELAKTRMQIMSDKIKLGGSAPHYKNPFDCLQKMFKAEGIRGVFKGQLITVSREVRNNIKMYPFLSIYLHFPITYLLIFIYIIFTFIN